MRRRDDGESLVEILVAVAILGIAFVSILTGIGTLVMGTDIHRKQSDAYVVLENAGEAVKADSNTFVRCAVASDYASALTGVTRPSGWSAPVINSVAYWNGSTFGATCYDSTAAPNLAPLQLITIEAKSPDGRADVSIAIVKRRAS